MRFVSSCLVLSVALFSSCSLFAPSTQAVTMTATDPAAEIFVDGNSVGRGSASVQLRRNQSHTVMARVGDRVGTASIGTTVSATGVLDIIGGIFFLFPFLGLAGPGFWSLDPNAVTIAVPPPANH